MVRDAVESLSDAVKQVYEQLPIHDKEKKLHIKKEKIRRLKQQENEIFADIGRREYRQNEALKYPLHRQKINKIQQERRVLEREMEELLAQCHPEISRCVCAVCGRNNAVGLPYCRFCGQALQNQICTVCKNENPAQSAYCGHCGAGLETKKQR